jgi:hypothetical protein
MRLTDAQIAKAYQIAKLHAAVDGAFPETLMQFWYESCWELCARHAGLVYPSEQIVEPVTIDEDGTIVLSRPPNGQVQFSSNGQIIATLPPDSPCFTPGNHARMCCPTLCCACNVRAHYSTGLGCSEEIPPSFLMAVARLFAYQCENRGDAELDEHVLGKCGAKTFLSPFLVYVL